MSEFETTIVPTETLHDGRLFIPASAVTEQPWVAEFIGRFSNYWREDWLLYGWVSPLPDPPHTEQKTKGDS